jgi:hypothetical protein
MKEKSMHRSLIALLLLLAPALVLPLAAGCAQKVTTVERKESVHESEPQMVSPGKEVVE